MVQTVYMIKKIKFTLELKSIFNYNHSGDKTVVSFTIDTNIITKQKEILTLISEELSRMIIHTSKYYGIFIESAHVCFLNLKRLLSSQKS